MQEQLDSIWDRVRGELRRKVPDFKFHIWLEPLDLVAVDGQTLYVRAPDHIRTWVRDRYQPLLCAAAARSFDPAAVVEIVDGAWNGTSDGPRAVATAASARPDGLRLRPKYTFEQFVIGEGNRFAHAAALAVAEQPGQAYNPLFIHGRPGLGKTHLLHAIGNYVTVYGGGLTVRYATVEEFTTEFVHAVRSKDTTQFKRTFRGVDVLLLDDVQFLANKARTEEELFHTFNVLHDAGRQVVVTSDCTPDQLGGIEARLGERVGSGLVIGLDAPDLTVRRAILHKRARLDSVPADSELIEAIATRVTSSVRALEAALIQVVAYASLRNETPSPELAHRLLDRLSPSERFAPCSVPAILAATAKQFGVNTDTLLARDRRPAVSRARKVAMYLTRELTGQSFPEIGRGFGNRDHSTVLHAVRSVTSEVGHDPELALAVHKLRATLSHNP